MKNIKNIAINLLCLVCISISLYSLWSPIYRSRIIDTERARQEIQTFKESLSHKEKKESSTVNLKSLENEVIGVISIPEIDISLPVYYGLSEYALSTGVGTIESFAELSSKDGGHSILSSHNGLSVQGLFTNLHKLKKGDVFYIKNKVGEILEYKVNQIDVVYPDNISIFDLKPSKNTVSLITCESIEGINSHRRIVSGELSKTLTNDSDVFVIKQAPLTNYEYLAIAVTIFIFIWGVIIFVNYVDKKRKENQQ